MYGNGESVDVNIRIAIHHFEKYEQNEGHCSLAFICKNELGFADENRAVYHFQLAANLNSAK